MKCPNCNKENMIKYKDEIKQDGVAFEAYKCQSCGEEIMDMKQLKLLADKYRKLRKAKEVTFAKWGNSIAIRIPRDIALEYNIKSGKQGLLIGEDGGIKIIPS